MSAPIQNTGIEIPTSASTVRKRSENLPALTAVKTPSATANTIHMMAAPIASEKVRGMPLMISSTHVGLVEVGHELAGEDLLHRLAVLHVDGLVEAPLLADRLDLSRWWVARRPSARAGSPPGITLKIRNVSTEMANSTSTIDDEPPDDEAGHQRSTRTLARGSKASRTPSPKTLRASTASTSITPGHDRQVRAR